MAYIVCACIVMALMVMAYIVMAYIVMACIVMAQGAAAEGEYGMEQRKRPRHAGLQCRTGRGSVAIHVF